MGGLFRVKKIAGLVDVQTIFELRKDIDSDSKLLLEKEDFLLKIQEKLLRMQSDLMTIARIGHAHDQQLEQAKAVLECYDADTVKPYEAKLAKLKQLEHKCLQLWQQDDAMDKSGAMHCSAMVSGAMAVQEAAVEKKDRIMKHVENFDRIIGQLQHERRALRCMNPVRMYAHRKLLAHKAERLNEIVAAIENRFIAHQKVTQQLTSAVGVLQGHYKWLQANLTVKKIRLDRLESALSQTCHQNKVFNPCAKPFVPGSK